MALVSITVQAKIWEPSIGQSGLPSGVRLGDPRLLPYQVRLSRPQPTPWQRRAARASLARARPAECCGGGKVRARKGVGRGWAERQFFVSLPARPQDVLTEVGAQ